MHCWDHLTQRVQPTCLDGESNKEKHRHDKDTITPIAIDSEIWYTTPLLGRGTKTSGRDFGSSINMDDYEVLSRILQFQ